VRLKENGQWVDGFTEYLIPTAKEVPVEIKTLILEIPERSGPWGAKGVAEMGVVATAPAIANAVYNAVGVRAHSLPIRPEMVALGREAGTRR
jgi:xanthine dehydrogenase molybdenum-binding subunit